MTPLDQLKKKIYRLNNLYMIVAICLIASLYAVNIPQLILLIISFPILTTYIIVIKRIKTNTFFIHTFFLKNMYEKMILKWLKNYINSSNSILEKQYKLMFLGFAINARGINKFPQILDFIKESYAEIKQNKNLILKLNAYQIDDDYFLSRESQETVKNIDMSNSKNKEILNLLYKDFSNLGLLGLCLSEFDCPAFTMLNELQQNKLTENDKINIRKTILKLKQIEFDMNSDMSLNSKITKICVLENFILNDKDMNNLDLYKDFCRVMFKTKPNIKKHMFDLIDKKSI